MFGRKIFGRKIFRPKKFSAENFAVRIAKGGSNDGGPGGPGAPPVRFRIKRSVIFSRSHLFRARINAGAAERDEAKAAASEAAATIGHGVQ